MKNVLIKEVSSNIGPAIMFNAFDPNLDCESYRYICLDLDGHMYGIFQCSDYTTVTVKEVLLKRIPDIAKIYIDISGVPYDECEKLKKILFSIDYGAKDFEEKLTLNEIKHKGNWVKVIVVVEKNSCEDNSTLESRSFEVCRESSFFNPASKSSALFGNCIEKSGPQNFRLDLNIFCSNPTQRWSVDYCYVLDTK